MGEGNLKPSFEEVNYNLLNITSDPGEVMDENPHSKDETGTAIRNFTSHLMDPATWNGKKTGCRDEWRTFTSAKPSALSPMASVEPN